jgi:hypothetical protein
MLFLVTVLLHFYVWLRVELYAGVPMPWSTVPSRGWG